MPGEGLQTSDKLQSYDCYRAYELALQAGLFGFSIHCQSWTLWYMLLPYRTTVTAGNSGGPLLDSSGRLIGVNTAIFTPTGTSAGVGFAIPVNTVASVVPQLISSGRVLRPSLGVQVRVVQLGAGQ